MALTLAFQLPEPCRNAAIRFSSSSGPLISGAIGDRVLGGACGRGCPGWQMHEIDISPLIERAWRWPERRFPHRGAGWGGLAVADAGAAASAESMFEGA